MIMEDVWTFLVNVFLFFLAFKVGQISILVRSHNQSQEHSQNQLNKITRNGIKPIITIEEINGVYYAYDGNDFLGQGTTPDELGRYIAQRFPNKYHLAKIEFKA